MLHDVMIVNLFHCLGIQGCPSKEFDLKSIINTVNLKCERLSSFAASLSAKSQQDLYSKQVGSFFDASEPNLR